jgi:hypothetical protein
MKCTYCGEVTYKGRELNARKETTEEKYYNIAIFRFYIRTAARLPSRLTPRTWTTSASATRSGSWSRGARPSSTRRSVWTDSRMLNGIDHSTNHLISILLCVYTRRPPRWFALQSTPSHHRLIEKERPQQTSREAVHKEGI